jgi:hypothetical protein
MYFAKMMLMMKRILLFLMFIVLSVPVSAQGAAGQLLARINDLRASVGQAGYTTNGALTAAASAHATWMVNSGQISHTGENGSNPRTRAQNAGYSSNLVSENIYMGSSASIESAWSFWLNSPIHYAGMTSPNYNNIGIGTASGANGYAFVLVFGNSSGSLPSSGSGGVRSGGASSGGNTSEAVAPSYVVGVDGIGNIMHEVQAGDTFGDIALIYGYTWEDLPYMLEVNGMTEDSYLEIGSVFLVPPQSGTYTPSPAPPTQTPTATHTPSPLPQTATESRIATQMIAPATFVMPPITPTERVIIRSAPTPTAPVIAEETQPTQPPSGAQPLLMIAIIVQLGVIGIATFEFIRRSR